VPPPASSPYSSSTGPPTCAPLPSPSRGPGNEIIVRFRPFDSTRLLGAVLSSADLRAILDQYGLELVEIYEQSGAYRLRARRDPQAAVAALRADPRTYDAEVAPDLICPLSLTRRWILAG
jgi:hypothetical protein